jgi:hypothetical protein
MDSTAMTSAAICSVLFVTAVSACAGGNTRPTVLPRLDSLPDEHVSREQRLEGAAARPGPETQKGKSSKWRQAETAAATAAAIVGSIFSTTKTVTVGISTSIDENTVLDPERAKNGGKAKDDEVEPETYDPNQLTPWVKLGTPDAD